MEANHTHATEGPAAPSARVLVTGAAGFIGSHVVDRLLAQGSSVVGVDCFDTYYERAIKERNLRAAETHPRFHALELDLAQDPLDTLLDGVSAVVHLAAIAGVRESWGDAFKDYTRNNVLATQRLLEAVRTSGVEHFIYISSASVYGDDARGAVRETHTPAPHSPYGVTKFAGEHLSNLYRRVHGVPTTTLRLFSCYGPRERPDKAIQKFLTAVQRGDEVEMYGDGRQVRDFSFVGDIVDGIVATLDRGLIGETINLARGEPATLRQVLETIESVTGTPLAVRSSSRRPGEVRVTHACIDKARRLLDYDPATSLSDGISAQWEHVRRAQAMT